jgi:CarD family transcriptional regulator
VFETGEYVVYGNLGVCRVQDRVTRRFDGLDAEHLYYVLEPVYQGGVLYVPADNPKIYLRAVISADEANRLIDSLPKAEGEAFHSRSAQELSAHYEQAMQTHKCEDLIELTKSIYHKKEKMARQGKKFGRVDEHYMRQAEDTLFGELAVALGIPREGVQGYIAQRLNTPQPERV